MSRTIAFSIAVHGLHNVDLDRTATKPSDAGFGYMFPVDVGASTDSFFLPSRLGTWGTWASAWKASTLHAGAPRVVRRSPAQDTFNLNGATIYGMMRRQQGAKWTPGRYAVPHVFCATV